MANKGLALLVICLVIFPAILLPKAAVAQDLKSDAEFFSLCFKACHNTCQAQGNGNSFCEMKCDTDCFNKEFQAKLEETKLDTGRLGGLNLP